MKTTIPVGTIIKTRYKGSIEYSKVVELPLRYHNGDSKFALQYCELTADEMKNAVKAVWKGESLEQR